MSLPSFELQDAETETLQAWATRVQEAATSPFEAARQLATRLGAQLRGPLTSFGFWVPELNKVRIDKGSLALELFSPLEPVSYGQPQTLKLFRERLPVQIHGDYVWAVVSGLSPGHREHFGDFYWLSYRTASGEPKLIRDPLAYSLPFGVYGPAELYDIDRLHHDRADIGFFRKLAVSSDEDEVPRFGPPLNILQLHAAYVTEEGSLGALARLYNDLAHKVTRGEALSPAEKNFVEYDAVQLMPIEPVVEHENEPSFFKVPEGETGQIEVRIRKPDMTNWGYDIVIAGSSAVNPALLESGRPDELVDLAVALHTFPGKPMRLVLDLVFGHADNQALELLNEYFFSGPNMYGQDMNFRHPVVRALMLEMQRRKVDFGADSVRVDGAQDFKYWDEEKQETFYDDEYLNEMSNIVQRVGGVAYLPFLIFEDGRPWPRPDWETASTYRDVIEDQPHVFQWGPLTFAHNTPHLEGFWDKKWWRIEEIAEIGDQWVSGCANHDTLRRGYQIEVGEAVNQRLGDTLREIIAVSYDHPAKTLLTYGIFPGTPMEFIAATMRAPWAFIRNTDARYGVKVAAEETGFLYWRVDGARFAKDNVFSRVKALGFQELGTLRRFMDRLKRLIEETDYDLDQMVNELNDETPGFPVTATEDLLHKLAKAYMNDLHDFCKVWHHQDALDDMQADFNYQTRAFRRQRPWLMQALAGKDRLTRSELDGSTFFYGFRSSPDQTEQLLFIGNMEGEARTLEPLKTGIDDLPEDGWALALATPSVAWVGPDHALKLANAQAVLLRRAAL